MADLEMKSGTSLQQPRTVVSKTWFSKGIMRKVEGRGLCPLSPDAWSQPREFMGCWYHRISRTGLTLFLIEEKQT